MDYYSFDGIILLKAEGSGNRMFSFLTKKKKDKKDNEPEIKEPVINEEQKNELYKQIKELEENLLISSAEDRIKCLNTLGDIFFQLQDTDQAIQYYEKSIEENRTLGKTYTNLVKLYNIKRKEAAWAKDDEKLQHYLNKIDMLLKMTKDEIRGL
jgi:tetratricopeptide (TPR) repeat protein